MENMFWFLCVSNDHEYEEAKKCMEVIQKINEEAKFEWTLPVVGFSKACFPITQMRGCMMWCTKEDYDLICNAIDAEQIYAA